MNTARTSHISLFALLLFALCTGTAAQQCVRPAPPGQYLNTPPRQQSMPVRNSDQETMDKMARGTYGRATGMPSKKEDLAIERRYQVQQQIVAQSAQLLILARQLNADASASGENQLSASAVKEAAKIEKLAKSIKNKTMNAH